MLLSYVEGYVVRTVKNDLTLSFLLYRFHAQLRMKRQKHLQAFYFARNSQTSLQHDIVM